MDKPSTLEMTFIVVGYVCTGLAVIAGIIGMLLYTGVLL